MVDPNEETSWMKVTSYILMVSSALLFAGALFLPWYSIELGVFERLTGTVGAVYRVPTMSLGALTFVLGLLIRTELGPRLWRLPMALTVAGAALAVSVFDVIVVLTNLNDGQIFDVPGPFANQRLGTGVWVVLIGTAMQFGLGLLSWGLEHAPRREHTARAQL
jgi:hypothetical protein